jgi:hypothetical protein
MTVLATVQKKLAEIHNEPGTGTLSWGRVASSAAFLCSVVWVSWVMAHTFSIPPLDGITAFIAGPYTANKLGAMGQAFSKNPVASQGMPPATIIDPNLPVIGDPLPGARHPR